MCMFFIEFIRLLCNGLMKIKHTREMEKITDKQENKGGKVNSNKFAEINEYKWKKYI